MSDENKVIDFKPKQAYMTTGGNDWLSELTVGTVFLYRNSARQGPMDVGVQQAEVVHKYERCTQLFSCIGGGETRYIVENAPFSSVMRKVEVLYVPEVEAV